MSKSLRSRVSFNRKRFNIRRIVNLRNTIILVAVVAIFVVSTSVVGAYMLKKKVAKSTIKFEDTSEEVLEASSNVDIYDDGTNNIQIATNNEVNDNKDNANTNNDSNNSNNITINLLGEIMMGGDVTRNLDYIYSYAFKDVYVDAKSADFTYSNLSTNITNMDKLEDTKSKYIVTKDVISGLKTLGIDAVSIASDHMMDFSSTMFRTTTGILENSNIYVAGQKDNPVYFEKNNKKIAIVSTNSVVIGTKSVYENNNISMYDSDNLKKNIEEAKKSAGFVIVDVHWGKDYEYGVTSQMTQMAHEAIDSGADMVIGSHALGVYPIITYKGKPIIYSLGYLISDTNYLVGKESFIFNVSLNNDLKLEKITMTPTYIKDKEQVVLYKNYDVVKMNEFLEQMNNWNLENSLKSSINDGKIIIDFNNS